MITNAATASNLAPEVHKSSLKSSRDGGDRHCQAAPKSASAAPKAGTAAPKAGAGHADASTPDWNYDSKTSLSYTRTEDLYLKYTARNGDVLEVGSRTTEEFRYEEHVSISADARALAARACGNGDKGGRRGPALYGADGAAEAGAAQAEDQAEALDPKAKQLKELREWARQVEREVRLQQHKILERLLKQSGKDGEGHGSPFLVVTREGVCVRPGGAEKTEEAQVPEYWNAENTSDRIVHFATQMAEISGMDPVEFGRIIKEAVSNGFDQAGAATGELTGAAAKLNKDTKDLVFSKLSKWLEERKDMTYNQGARNPEGAGAHGAAPSVADRTAGSATGPG